MYTLVVRMQSAVASNCTAPSTAGLLYLQSYLHCRHPALQSLLVTAFTTDDRDEFRTVPSGTVEPAEDDDILQRLEAFAGCLGIGTRQVGVPTAVGCRIAPKDAAAGHRGGCEYAQQ